MGVISTLVADCPISEPDRLGMELYHMTTDRALASSFTSLCSVGMPRSEKYQTGLSPTCTQVPAARIATCAFANGYWPQKNFSSPWTVYMTEGP